MRNLFILILIMFSGLMFSQVPGHVPTDGLVAYWPFDGNAIDLSGNGYDGIMTSVSATPNRSGDTEKALYFSSQNCEPRVDVDLDNTSINGGITISFWINRVGDGCISPRIFEAWPGADDIMGRMVVNWRNTDDPNPLFNLVHELETGNGSNDLIINFNQIPLNKWSHLVYTNDGLVAKTYQDGQLVEEITCPGGSQISMASDFAIGRMNHSAWDAFNGNMDDFGIWDRALTQSEIQELYTGVNQSEPTALCQDITIQLSETDAAVQAGNPVYLNGQGPNGGISMDMSEDGNTIVYGAPYNTDTPGVYGIAVVYEWNGMDWVQKGSTLESTNSADEFGYTVDISQDGNRIAVRGNQPNGYVNIYEWSGSDWMQLGNAITSGTSAIINGVSLSANGSRVAVKTLNPHYCRVYDWNGTQWTQVGQEIFNHAGSPYGTNVALSPDGTQLAIGGPVNSSTSGVIKVYNYDGSSWVQTGSDITGSSANDWFGQNVIYSPDGTKIGVVAPFDDAGTGYVAIYSWDGSDWAQFGANIPVDGVNTNYLRTYLSMNQDGSRVAVGAMGAQNNGTNSGQISIFDWDGNQWVQNIENILGQGAYSIFGRSVSLSADGSRVAAYSIHTGEFFAYDLLPAGLVTITPADIDNGSTDNCGIATLSLDQTAFDCSHVGENTVTLTVTDVSGNTDECTAIVTVEDDIDPTALCQNVTVELDVSGLNTVEAANIDNGSSDLCGIAGLELSQTNFDCSNIEENTVTLTVTDNNDNTSTCDAVVTVVDNIAPEALCQDVTVTLDVDGLGSTTAVLVDNGSNDACGIASLVLSQTAFDCTHVGTVAVVLTVTDNNDNTSTCDAVVTVEDNIAPEALCQDITVQLDVNGLGSTTAASVDNGSNDACGIASLVLSQTDFNCNHVGPVDVVLTVTDNNDNTSTCDAVVTVEDNIVPEAICQDVTVELDADGLGITTSESVDNGSTDACGIASLVLSQTAFDCTHVGTVAVVLTVTDVNDNTSTCDAVVTVEDNIAPEALCQDVTVDLDVDGSGSTTAALVDNGSNDACGVASLVLSKTDFDCSDVGEVTVTLTVADVNTNTATCDATVTVEDNIAPEAICQDVTVELDVDGLGSTTAESVDNGSNDACGIASLILSQTDFDCDHVGTIAVVLTVTDNNDNTSTCDAVVTVEDNIAPEALCQDVTVQLDVDGLGSTIAESVDNGSTDACGVASLVLSKTDFDCSDVGEVTVTLTVADVNTNTATCDATVTVEDNIAPEAICQDVTVELDVDGSGSTTAALVDNGSNDACGIASLVLSQTDFDCSHVGEVTVTLTVTDVNTNSATCDAIVIVEDNLAPVMDCPSITVNLAPGLCGQIVDYTVNVSDNCGVESLVLMDGVESGTYLDYHDSPWTSNWEATDVNGNSSNCTVEIEMFEYSNPSATLACNNNVEIALDEMGCTLIGADMILEGGPYGCYDDYIVSVANGNAEVCCDAVGSTLNVTVTDPDTGNNCSGTISVVDYLSPTCVSIEDYTIACQDEIPSTDDLDHLGYPVFGDNCAIETILLASETIINNDICLAPGIQLERKWLAIDVNGNAMELADACTQIITIERTAITFPVDQEYDCSEYSLEDLSPDLTGSPFPASFETCMYTVTYNDQVFESCGGLQKIFRTWSVLDMCSEELITIDANGTSNVQLISLIDTEAPQVELADMVFSTDANQCAFTGFITAGSVTDNCTGVQTIQMFIEGVAELDYAYNAAGQVIGGFVPTPGIGLGDHTLKVVVSDSCTNASEVFVTVSIEDQITPTAICDEITQVALSSDGTATVFAETFDNGSYDNCCLEGFEVRRLEDTAFEQSVVFDCEDLTGSNQVVLKVDDCYGNSNTCMVEVLVEDKLFPYLTVPADQEISCEIYYSDIAAELEIGNPSVLDDLFGTATFGDNCSFDTTYTYTYDVDQCGVGSIVRSWTVTDGSGNGPISGTQTISIYHVSDWEVTFPGEITVNCTDGELPEIGEPTINGDNCEVIAVSFIDTQFDIVSGACYKIIREWSVINWCTYPQEPAVLGTQIINVEDTEAPIFDVENFTVEILETDCDVEVTLPTPEVSDCSDDITITVESVLMDGEVGPGIYTANYTVNDGCGNYSYDEVLVTVIDAKDPTPYVTDGLVTEIMASGETLVVEATDFDIASFDNCTDVSLSFSPDVNHTDTIFTCDNLGPNTLNIWVTDAYGNQDYAIVTLTVQDNLNTCSTNQLTVAGLLNTEDGVGIDGAVIDVNGGAYTQNSMVDGSYEFALPYGGDYTVAPVLDVDASNGVTTFDVVLITQHILGMNYLDTPYQLIAADANKSNSISTLDVVAIRMVVLQMADAFPNNTSWRFVDADHVFVDPTNPWDFPEVINYNDLEVNKLETDFIGVKIGDVNGSAQANILSPAENRNGKSFELKTMDKQVSAGDEVRVTLQSDARISGMQFTLEHNGLEYKGMEAGLMNAEHIASHGSALTFSWNEFELKNLKGEDLVTLIFEAKGSVQLSESMVITSSMTKAEGYTEQGIESVDLVFENNKSVANVLYQNEPNPFDGQTVISFRLNKAGKVQILITDLDGKLIQEIEGTYPQGLNSLELDRIHKAGVYYYQLSTEGFTATRKMIKI